MLWNVVFCDEFDVEFKLMAEGLQDELLAHALLLIINIADKRYQKHLTVLAMSQPIGKGGKHG